MRVKCLAPEYNTKSTARTQARPEPLNPMSSASTHYICSLELIKEDETSKRDILSIRPRLMGRPEYVFHFIFIYSCLRFAKLRVHIIYLHLISFPVLKLEDISPRRLRRNSCRTAFLFIMEVHARCILIVGNSKFRTRRLLERADRSKTETRTPSLRC